MSLLELLLLIFSIHSLASPISRYGTMKAPRAADPPYSVDSNTLAAALTCPYGNPTADSPPVLLVHGTGSTGKESWGDGYVPALRDNGYTACYVTLPGRAMVSWRIFSASRPVSTRSNCVQGDMQISAEYVAYSIHRIVELSSGAQASVISHSQGGPNVQWALQFFPSTRPLVKSFIALSPDFTGINLLGSRLSSICVGKICQASLWQQSAGSHYYDALHSRDFRALVPTTSIYTQFDGVINPPKANAQLPGAKVVSVQSICPLRGTTHPAMTIDSAAFALALDALNHGGKASVMRVLPRAIGICWRVAGKDMDVSIEQSIEDSINTLIDGFL